MRKPDFQPTPFAQSLTSHMCSWRRGVDGSSHPMLASWVDGIHPDYQELAQAVVAADEVRLHDFAAALTSSQMFALNLFLPFREDLHDSLSEALTPVVGERMEVQRLSFEWIPPGALLGEIDGDRPEIGECATAVDVVVWGAVKGDAKVAVLLEVKLGEGGFTTCGGRYSHGNRRPDICATAHTFFCDPDACYLRRPVRKARDRRYWSIFTAAHGSVQAAFPGAELDGPCPFAGQAQQPMRNLAIARGMEQEGLVNRAWFGLCAHDANPDVSSHWSEWRKLLRDPQEAPVLPASALIQAGRAAGRMEWADWMCARYRLTVPS